MLETMTWDGVTPLRVPFTYNCSKHFKWPCQDRETSHLAHVETVGMKCPICDERVDPVSERFDPNPPSWVGPVAPGYVLPSAVSTLPERILMANVRDD